MGSEEPDGTGYPRGLTDGGIPMGAKILAVVDAFDALVVGRPYRTAVSNRVAMEELRRHERRQFDPKVIDALDRVLEERKDDRHVTPDLPGEEIRT